MKKAKEKFDFKAFGQAIKAARKAKGYSRNALADELNIAPRYIASIENSGHLHNFCFSSVYLTGGGSFQNRRLASIFCWEHKNPAAHNNGFFYLPLDG